MKIIRWAAVAVTALFVVMNLGAAFDPEQSDAVRIGGAVLAAVGIPAVVGTSVATERIKSGDRVRVNGTSGVVEVLQ